LPRVTGHFLSIALGPQGRRAFEYKNTRPQAAGLLNIKTQGRRPQVAGLAQIWLNPAQKIFKELLFSC
tara:strand:- start:207 stop:410 length:204 start_codon:yes stop_codon:yes gene_type:complete